jgi:membrane associated rhomboid family serine protease
MSGEKSTSEKRFRIVLLITGLTVGVFFLIHILNLSMDMKLNQLGVEPRVLSGLIGIIAAPLIHGSWSHLIGNSMSFIVLASLLFYFYPDIGYRIFAMSWIIVGILVWIFGRQSFHIGASGVIYAMAGFLVLSGIIRRHYQLMSISLIVIFLYGSMFWGIFPGQPGISWESHLSGFLVGFTLAVIFRNKGPKKSIASWEKAEEPEDDFYLGQEYDYSSNHSLFKDVHIHYEIEQKDKMKNEISEVQNNSAKKSSKGFSFNPKNRNFNRTKN